jgi:hypothetical protein
MSFIDNFIGRIIALVVGRSAKRFEKATRNPRKTQEDKLLGIIRKNENTEYGKRYNFASIHSIADYQKQVPIVTYEDIRPYMDRVVDGESNILTAEDPIGFAQTSGTTGNPKYIPITPTCKGREHRDVTQTWICHSWTEHPTIMAGKIVSLVSPAVEGVTPSGLPYGSASGQIYRDMPPIVAKMYAVPYCVFEIEDYQAKYYAIMRVALSEDVRSLFTANPSSILKMCEKANEFAETIIQDIREGTLSRNFSIMPDIRRELEATLEPDPHRADQLQQMRDKRGGKLLPGDYWPNLDLIGCWKGGTVGHYLKHFPDWFDPDGTKPVPVRDWGYLSSEARGSIPITDEGSRGVLTVATNFFEFVPVDELEANPDDTSTWTFLTAADMEDGGEYYVFFTTTAGLYRYDINDVVKMQGKHNETPQIIFLRKGRGMTNLTGEKVSVNQIIDAFHEAAELTGALPSHFKAEASIETSRYILRVEFEKEIDEATQLAFAKALDAHLKAINIEYKGKRDSMRLKAPLLHVMREGWYERGRRQWVAGGKRAFQAKTQVLSAEKLQTQQIQADLLNVIDLEELGSQDGQDA